MGNLQGRTGLPNGLVKFSLTGSQNQNIERFRNNTNLSQYFGSTIIIVVIAKFVPLNTSESTDWNKFGMIDYAINPNNLTTFSFWKISGTDAHIIPNIMVSSFFLYLTFNIHRLTEKAHSIIHKLQFHVFQFIPKTHE